MITGVSVKGDNLKTVTLGEIYFIIRERLMSWVILIWKSNKDAIKSKK